MTGCGCDLALLCGSRSPGNGLSGNSDEPLGLEIPSVWVWEEEVAPSLLLGLLGSSGALCLEKLIFNAENDRILKQIVS